MEAALRDPDADGPQSLDPAALMLAVWLGLMVSVAGLVRLASDMPAPDMRSDPAIPTGFAV